MRMWFSERWLTNSWLILWIPVLYIHSFLLRVIRRRHVEDIAVQVAYREAHDGFGEYVKAANKALRWAERVILEVLAEFVTVVSCIPSLTLTKNFPLFSAR